MFDIILAITLAIYGSMYANFGGYIFTLTAIKTMLSAVSVMVLNYVGDEFGFLGIEFPIHHVLF
jgi:hypothetical protein